MLFRQIELNWINAPLNDDGDYIALYLDTEPDAAGGSTPVSVHHPNGISGKLLVQDHYLPVIDFYNETFGADVDGRQVWPMNRSGDNYGEDVGESPPRGALDRSSGEIESAPSSPQFLDQDDHHQRRHRAQHQLDDNHHWHRYRPVGVPATRRVDSVLDMPEVAQSDEPADGPLRSGRRRRQHEMEEAGGVRPLTDECIGYCVAYHSQRRILAKSCLRTRPNWMHEAQIGSRSVTSIAIAGTHNSGTYLKQRPGSHKIGKLTHCN